MLKASFSSQVNINGCCETIDENWQIYFGRSLYVRLACQTGTGREGGGEGEPGRKKLITSGTRSMAITVRYPQKISLFFDSAQLLLAITFKGNWSEGCKILR